MLMMVDTIFSIWILLGWRIQDVNFKDTFLIIKSYFLWLLLQRLFSAYNIILVFIFLSFFPYVLKTDNGRNVKGNVWTQVPSSDA